MDTQQFIIYHSTNSHMHLFVVILLHFVVDVPHFVVIFTSPCGHFAVIWHQSVMHFASLCVTFYVTHFEVTLCTLIKI